MAETQEMALYGFWRSSATYRVRVALALKNATAHEHIVNLEAGDQNSQDFRAINPHGAVPALILPGQAPLTQSMAILEFLDETLPGPALLPQNAFARARVRAIAGSLAADTHPLLVPRIKHHLMTAGQFDDAMWRAWQIQWLTTGLSTLETRLASESETGLFCHGDSITLADLCLMSIVIITRVFKITIHAIPTIDAIVQRCDAHPAFIRANPFQQPGAPPALG